MNWRPSISVYSPYVYFNKIRIAILSLHLALFRRKNDYLGIILMII